MGSYTSSMSSSGKVRTSQTVKRLSGTPRLNCDHLLLIESTGFGGGTLDLLNFQKLHHPRECSRSLVLLRLNNPLHNRVPTIFNIRHRSFLSLTTQTQPSPCYIPLSYPWLVQHGRSSSISQLQRRSNFCLPRILRCRSIRGLTTVD